MDERDTPDIQGILALALGIIAWVSFLLAFFMADDPFLFLLFAIVCGTIALVIGIRARREEQAGAAAGAAAAGAALIYGVSVVAALTAMVYAMGVLLMLVMIFFLMILFAGGSAGSGGGCGGGGGGGPDPCCCEDCCDDCGGSCCDCGCTACDCGCGDCGGCGGCGCIGFGIVLPHVGRPLGFRERIQTVLARGMPHHPDLPEFAVDVYVVNGARWCIGCFTTYPVFLAATALLIAFTPPSAVALALGAALAAMQAVSSLGLARRRGIKVAVKTALGVGLALVVSGIHSAAWPPAWKVAALLATLGLAYLSALPRAKRMRKLRERSTA